MCHFCLLKSPKALKDVFCGGDKVYKTFWSCDLFIFKDSAFAAFTKGRKSLNWVCIRGTIRQ